MTQAERHNHMLERQRLTFVYDCRAKLAALNYQPERDPSGIRRAGLQQLIAEHT
jgi:hypothetical protein